MCTQPRLATLKQGLGYTEALTAIWAHRVTPQ